jgi:hypothetical protein
LLHSIAYSPSYFERFDQPLPENAELPQPRALSPFESPTFDTQDAVVHLASDRADVVLEAEQALRGEQDQANGVSVDARLTDVATIDSRRTGFVGAGLPANHQDAAGIPDSKPVPEASSLFMGFEAGFRGTQATEDYVTIQDGPFAGATTKVIANLRQRLEDWYDEQSFEDRVIEMFSPGYAENDLVEDIGSNLDSDSGVRRRHRSGRESTQPRWSRTEGRPCEPRRGWKRETPPPPLRIDGRYRVRPESSESPLSFPTAANRGLRGCPSGDERYRPDRSHASDPPACQQRHP